MRLHAMITTSMKKGFPKLFLAAEKRIADPYFPSTQSANKPKYID
jgi:hypothetical protein